MSKIELLKLFFDEISFVRVGNNPETNSFESNISCNCYASKEHKNEYKITMILDGEQKENFKVKLTMSGVFEITTENEKDLKIYLNNAVSIMFPYLRAQLSMLTSQPEMKPIVIPIVNMKKDKKNSD